MLIGYKPVQRSVSLTPSVVRPDGNQPFISPVGVKTHGCPQTLFCFLLRLFCKSRTSVSLCCFMNGQCKCSIDASARHLCECRPSCMVIITFCQFPRGQADALTCNELSDLVQNHQSVRCVQIQFAIYLLWLAFLSSVHLVSMSRLALLLSSLQGVWFCLNCGKANFRFMGLHYTRLGLAEPLQRGPNRALNKTIHISNMERKGSTPWSESDQSPGVKFQ